jgi:hypothetical protein
MYEPLHPVATFTIEAEAITEVTPGKRRHGTPTSVGSFEGGYEDLSATKMTVKSEGLTYRLRGRTYADRSLDPGVLIGHVVKFSHPATSEAHVLRCVNRIGPFDATDDEDHFELELGSEMTGAT